MIWCCKSHAKFTAISSIKRLYILIALLLFAVFPAAQSKIPVWIDTDPAVGEKDRDVDDGLALLQAFHSPELEIVGVSAVFGNAPLERAYPIAQKIVADFGPQGLKVHRGAASGNELGQETSATTALTAALRQQKLTIFVLGPATNVATVLDKHPQLAAQINEIIAVAGRRPGQRFQTGSKNRKAHRDFNFELDPKAFEIILRSPVPLTLAPFEISSKVWMRQTDLDRLAQGTNATRWLAAPARQWLGLWQDVFAVDGFNPFDTLAIAYLTSPQLILSEQLPAQIQTLPDDVTEERMQGVKVNEKPYLLVAKDLKSQRQVRYCYQAKAQFKEDLLERLLRSP